MSKINLNTFSGTDHDEYTNEEFQKAFPVSFSDEAIRKFDAELIQTIKKGEAGSLSQEQADALEKASKDRSGLVKKRVMRSDGHMTTRWVRPDEGGGSKRPDPNHPESDKPTGYSDKKTGGDKLTNKDNIVRSGANTYDVIGVRGEKLKQNLTLDDAKHVIKQVNDGTFGSSSQTKPEAKSGSIEEARARHTVQTKSHRMSKNSSLEAIEKKFGKETADKLRAELGAPVAAVEKKMGLDHLSKDLKKEVKPKHKAGTGSENISSSDKKKISSIQSDIAERQKSLDAQIAHRDKFGGGSRSNYVIQQASDAIRGLKKEIAAIEESYVSVTDKELTYGRNGDTLKVTVNGDKYVSSTSATGRSKNDGRFNSYETRWTVSKNGKTIEDSTSYVHELADPNLDEHLPLPAPELRVLKRTEAKRIDNQ